MKPPGPAFGRPDDKLHEIRDSRETKRWPRMKGPPNGGPFIRATRIGFTEPTNYARTGAFLPPITVATGKSR